MIGKSRGRVLFLYLAAALAALAGPLSSRADAFGLTVLDSSHDGSKSAESGIKGYPVGIQVTLLQTTTISTVAAWISSDTSLSDLSVTIFNDNGNHPGSTALATSTSTSGGPLPSSSIVEVDFSFASPSLAAGTYWLMMASSTFNMFSWQIQSAGQTNTTPYGTVNNRSYVEGAVLSETLLARVTGDIAAAAVPEPSTLVLAGAGMAALGLASPARKLRKRLFARS